MFGFSVFLNEDMTREKEVYMKHMLQSGFEGIFTSIHIPEDDDNKYLERLQKLGFFAKKHGIELVIDISGTALEKLGITFSDLNPLKEMGITAIRMDYGISMENVALVSRAMGVALNASTLTEEDFALLKEYDANFENMEAWHNYYPRPETGLGKRAFHAQNKKLKAAGFRVMAFVPGDGQQRGPLFDGLPTLEKHRSANPLAAALELTTECCCDKVYIGDPGLSQPSREQFSYYLNEGGILFHAFQNTDNKTPLSELFYSKHTNRLDAARDVIRSAEARLIKKTTIKPDQTTARVKGSITIDNDQYGRYEGEMQLTKVDLPADLRVNVIGRVQPKDMELLAYCKAGQTFKVEWEE